MPIKPYYILLFIILIPNSGWAQNNTCSPNSGPELITSALDLTITEPSNNKVGFILPQKSFYLASAGYNVSCNCSQDKLGLSNTPVYLTATTPLERGNNTNYYKLNNYLEASVNFYLSSDQSSFVTLPFERQQINLANTNLCHNQTGTSLNTNYLNIANQGSIQLRLLKPFIGQIVIAPTVVANIYASLQPNTLSPIPIAQLVISGTLTAPQSCRIQQHNVISVEFGDIKRSDFINLAPGSRPASAPIKNIALTYQCQHISQNTFLELRFVAEATHYNSVTTYSNGIVNPDIGISIVDQHNNPITLNSGTLPFFYNAQAQSGGTMIQAYPIKISDRIPQEGIFTGNATIKIEFR